MIYAFEQPREASRPVSPQQSGNTSPPRRSPRTSPTIDRFPHPYSALNSTNVSSQWMTDDDQDDVRSLVSGGETEYEDATSMFGMSDEDYYADAVSMLSGVFYSARTSFDN